MDIVYWICAILLFGSGIFRIVLPEESIHLREHWRFREYEPSETYIKMERFGGIVCLVFAVILVIAIL
jgi:hypothetical protein